MNEEAGFISALAAEPNDRTTLLVYADWLEERNDPRTEVLRVLLAPELNWERIAELSSPTERLREWVVRLKCGLGSVVRLTSGPFADHVGQIVGVYPNDPDKIVVAVRV